MSNYWIAVVALWLASFTTTTTSLDTALTANGENVCTKTMKIFSNHTILFMKEVLQPYQVCDGVSIMGNCPFWALTQKFRFVKKSFLRVVLKVKSRNLTECCPGYKQIRNTCPIPICLGECEHGKCIKPNHCQCLPGFQGKNCTQDVNECASSNHGNCSHVCINTMGSYICSCPLGWVLGKNKMICTRTMRRKPFHDDSSKNIPVVRIQSNQVFNQSSPNPSTSSGNPIHIDVKHARRYMMCFTRLLLLYIFQSVTY